MEISGKKPNLNINRYIQNAKPPKAGSRPGKGIDSGRLEDRVHLSNQARDIQRAARSLKEMPEVREDKVAEIQARIETGTYRVDARDIALKMIYASLTRDIA